MAKLQVWEEHQLKIAKQTLKMNDIMASVMGGPSRLEAKAIIKRLEAKRRKKK